MKPIFLLLLAFSVIPLQGCKENQVQSPPSQNIENTDAFNANQVFSITENDSYTLFTVNGDVQLALKSILYTFKINNKQIQIIERESNRHIASASLIQSNEELSGKIERLAFNKLKLTKIFKGIRLDLNILDESRSIELIKDNALSHLQVMDRTINAKDLTIRAKSYTGERDENLLFRVIDVPLAANPSLPKVLQDNRDLKPFLVDDQLLMVKKLDSNLSAHRFELLESVNLDEYVSEDFNVSYTFTSLDEKFNKLTFTVENLKEDKAFIISNPFESLKLNRCLGISKLTNYQSKRIKNKIVVEFSYLKNKSYACLENDFQGAVFVIDSKLKNLKVNFN